VGIPLVRREHNTANGTVIRTAWHARLPAFRSILLISAIFAALHAQDVPFAKHPLPVKFEAASLALSGECHQCPAQPAALQEIPESGPHESADGRIDFAGCGDPHQPMICLRSD
jgi:hypothetical protein